MGQEDNQATWYEKFKKGLNVEFTEEDFRKHKDMVEKELPLYKEHLKDGARILETGCGLGCTAVPLSTMGYDIVGVDNDADVVAAAKKNAARFGGNFEVVQGEIMDIDKLFGKDSFDACFSGGVLEHFPKEQIRKIIDKQLIVAPIAIAAMPVATKDDVQEKYKDWEKKICHDGIYRNLWTPEHWLSDILKGYNILERAVQTAPENIGGFQELFVVIGRKE
jgi:cyclopropane fatty-acyl-phospholipid synthase-like methyltransferase